MRFTVTRIMVLAGALAIGAATIYALIPNPILIDSETVTRGALEVTVEEEGVAQIREIYRVSAPIAGRVLRSTLEVGDVVKVGETIVATIQPGDPAFLDARTRQELEATVAAAEAAVALAQAQLRRAQSELRFAESELERAEVLSQTETISERTLEKARLDVDTRLAEVASAGANLELKRQELESARARLIGPQDVGSLDRYAEQCCVLVRAPVDGRVLDILVESEQVIPAGAALLDIGDPADLEIVVELLSSDAVKVEPGAAAYVENWGGLQMLHGRVERVDPAGFMKVSALGIEEQRVNTILTLEDPRELWQGLGHDFRVYVRIVIWRSDDVARLPVSALFRDGDDWAVFAVDDGRARLATVTVGHRNTQFVEVVAGLDDGQQVILHPSDTITDGSRVEQRHAE
jgi:HlyD family secretion protein